MNFHRLNDNRTDRFVFIVNLHVLHCVDGVETPDHSAKDCVDVVQVLLLVINDEELTSTGVGAPIGHGHNAPSIMLEHVDNFVVEILAVDAFAPLATSCRISSLNYKLFNVPVELRAVVIARGAQRQKVLGSLGN